MKAIVIQRFGGPDQLSIEETTEPSPLMEEVVVEVKAFGLNHAEIYFREGQWGDVAKISGIECVGTVKADPSGQFRPGQMVAALMGGMGRTLNGSYAEYTRVPSTNVVPLESSQAWTDLAAIPASYATAWTCLYRNLDLQAGQTLLIRGATSALGQAAVNIAAHSGARVIATTHNVDRFETLKAIGATETFREAKDLSHQVREVHPRGVDSVLELVGTSTLLDSLNAVRPDGRVCLAGFLGGMDPIDSFNPLKHLPSNIHLSFFASAFTFGKPDYPLSEIPFQRIFDLAASGIYRAKPAKVFRFDQIQDAHRLMSSGQANGKIVVSVP